MIKKKSLKVKSYITEKRRSLNQSISYAIKHKERIHISAPVGTGKTTLAIELIKKYRSKYQILLLEPQISISTQVYNKLQAEKKPIPAFVYNSKTFRKLTKWEDTNGMHWNETYISTIDSAWRLFEDCKLNPDNTIVIVDETHTLLQDGRPGFDQTARAILKANCPVIGFSATRSSWVLKFVLEIDRLINIEATDLPKKVITPFLVKGIPSTIAQVIEFYNLNKVIIFTNNIKMQEKINDAISGLESSRNVIIWNSETRDNSEKGSWKHLMEKDELPPDTNVAIINKVAMAGININDTDIDLVMLVDQFDPLGFLQYLGRCRHYDKEFDFLHKDFGEHEVDWQNPQEIESYLDLIEKGLANFRDTDIATLRKSDSTFKELYSKISGKYVLNRCVAARRVYEQFRELHGSELLKFIKVFAPDIEIKEYHTYHGIAQVTESTRKSVYRANKRLELPELVRKSAIYLVEMIQYLKPKWSHEEALTLIKKSAFTKKAAKDKGVLYVPNKRKKSLRIVIETSKQAGDPHLARVLLAARQYRYNKKDTAKLNAVMKLSMNDIKKLFNANVFFKHDFADDPLYKKVLDDIRDNEIGQQGTVSEWIDFIKSKLPDIEGIESTARLIFDSCLITQKKRVYVDVVRRDRFVLTEVVYTYEDYLRGNDLAHII
mgnify:CR=1 FL=1